MTKFTSPQTQAEKAKAFKLLQTRNAEGVVFKRDDAPYISDRPASGGDQLKFKFCETASCIVAGVNGKRSIPLEMFNEDAKPILVGNVTVPPNQPIPSKGCIVEVRYLYAYRGGALFQPVLIGVRDDIDPDECLLSQLKFKAEK